MRLRIPPGTQSGQRLRLRERGAPSIRGRTRGDLVCRSASSRRGCSMSDRRSCCASSAGLTGVGEGVRTKNKERRTEERRTKNKNERGTKNQVGCGSSTAACSRRSSVCSLFRSSFLVLCFVLRSLFFVLRSPAVVNMAKRSGKAYYMISAVAQKYNIHPQTLRLYEREGLLQPSRTDGNTRLYSEEDLEQLETILTLTRDLGVNLAGVEIILNMRRKMEGMQAEVNEFMEYVKRELARGIDDWEQRLSTALVKSSPTDLVRSTPPATTASTDATHEKGERPRRTKS